MDREYAGDGRGELQEDGGRVVGGSGEREVGGFWAWRCVWGLGRLDELVSGIGGRKP
jgi:hypothetical protein